MSAVVLIEDLLALLLSEQELRRLFGRLGLGDGLPGAGVTHATLCHEAAKLVDRRGRANQEFFQALADCAGERFGEVVEVAGSLGVTGLRPPPTPPANTVSASPSPSPAETPAARPRLLRRAALVALVMMAAALVYWRASPPCTSLEDALAGSGFQPSPGPSARLLPGAVLRVCEAGPDGPRRLENPVVWATGADCFSAVQPQDDNWEIPQHTCGSGVELSLDAQDLASWLPGLSAHAGALREARLELVRPRLHSLTELDLDQGFSPACAEKLAKSLSPPVQASWYQVVREAIVLDGLRLRVQWKGGLDAAARLAAEEGAGEAEQDSGLDLKIVTHSEDETVWEATGPLVLGWRGATARPELEGGATAAATAGSCP